jgi:hypothetical protein
MSEDQYVQFRDKLRELINKRLFDIGEAFVFEALVAVAVK